MKYFVGIVSILAIILGCSYFYLRSDVGMLGDKYLLEMLSTDVLGKSLYGKSCPRSSYIDEVDVSPKGRQDSTVIYKFTPLSGLELKCPSISIIVDRKTGETWINQ
ncbi:hypothetical protein D3C87_899160 [compost metagenome]